MKNFKGHSSERTWLTSILKHKILDHFRKRQRDQTTLDSASREDNVQQFFDETDHWKKGTNRWDTKSLAAQGVDYKLILSGYPVDEMTSAFF